MSDHGTVAHYVKGCRCEPCRAARRDYDRARWAKRKTTGKTPTTTSPRSYDRGVGPLTLDVADLRYSYGLSDKAIAAELGIGISAVSYHLAKHARLTRLADRSTTAAAA